MSTISVFLSDFQFLTQEGFKSLLARNDKFQLVGEEEDWDLLPGQLDKNRPDVLVIDYRPDESDFVNRLKSIKEQGVKNILILTSDTKKERVREILKTGVKGMVTKTCSEQEIVNSILAVSQGNRFYCNKILDIVMEQSVEEEENCAPTDLSPREYEVLQLITKGQTTTKIADTLHVSVHTINSHRKSILKKLNLKSPTELIVYALESGLVK